MLDNNQDSIQHFSYIGCRLKLFSESARFLKNLDIVEKQIILFDYTSIQHYVFRLIQCMLCWHVLYLY